MRVKARVPFFFSEMWWVGGFEVPMIRVHGVECDGCRLWASWAAVDAVVAAKFDATRIASL